MLHSTGKQAKLKVSQEVALQALMEQMALYPDDTIFFLNVWCFG